MKIFLSEIANPKQKIGSITLKYSQKKLNRISKYIENDLIEFQKLSQPRENLTFNLSRNSRGDVIVKLKEKGIFKRKEATNITPYHEITDHGWSLTLLSAFSRLYKDLQIDKLLKAITL